MVNQLNKRFRDKMHRKTLKDFFVPNFKESENFFCLLWLVFSRPISSFKLAILDWICLYYLQSTQVFSSENFFIFFSYGLFCKVIGV